MIGRPHVEAGTRISTRAFGPDEALEIVDALAEEPSMRSYHLVPSVRADLLVKLGRVGEARAEVERAAALTLPG